MSVHLSIITYVMKLRNFLTLPFDLQSRTTCGWLAKLGVHHLLSRGPETKG